MNKAKIQMNSYLKARLLSISRSTQNISAVNSATLELIQCDSVLSVGTSRYITKFVEWPVVDSVPARVKVLYAGHR